jgi:hypothetical protein
MPFGRYAVLQLALARQFSWRRTVVQTSALITGGECGFSLAVGPAQKKSSLISAIEDLSCAEWRSF